MGCSASQVPLCFPSWTLCSWLQARPFASSGAWPLSCTVIPLLPVAPSLPHSRDPVPAPRASAPLALRRALRLSSGFLAPGWLHTGLAPHPAFLQLLRLLCATWSPSQSPPPVSGAGSAGLPTKASPGSLPPWRLPPCNGWGPGPFIHWRTWDRAGGGERGREGKQECRERALTPRRSEVPEVRGCLALGQVAGAWWGVPPAPWAACVTLTHKACLWARVSCPLEAPGYTLGRFFLIPWGEDFTRPGIPPPRPFVPNPCCVPWSPTHAVSLSLPQYACGVEAEVVGKPSPEFFKSALQEMGVEAHEVSQLPPKCVPRGSCRGRPACSPGAAWVPEMSLGAQAPPGMLPGSPAGIPLPPPSPGMRADLTGVSGKDSKGGPERSQPMESVSV